VEYVKKEAKIVYLLECLQKTAPPVIIFCERKNDVDDIHEYLLLKGVEAVSIHGGKDQEERNEAIRWVKKCVCFWWLLVIVFAYEFYLLANTSWIVIAQLTHWHHNVWNAFF